MIDEFTADLITLIDNNGEEFEFEVLDILDSEQGAFYALSPVSEQSSLDVGYGYYIFEMIDSNGEQILEEVSDPILGDKLSAIFEARFEMMYETDTMTN